MKTKTLNIEDAIITDWLSPDERYCIFLDELYDIREKKLIGNIWENFENLKFFIRYSTSVSELKNEIKESIYNSLNGMVLTESLNESISKHKNTIKEFINENIFGDFVNWAKETGKSTVSGLRDFVKTTYQGASDLIDKISDFDLKAAFDIIGKGIFYLLRKLRDALYHPVGMILDAILVATGVGKAIQWVPWALVVGLDLYEIFSGNYEESFFQKLLFTLFDVIAMVTTGAIAKGLRLTLKGITKVDDLAKVVSQNNNVRQIFQKTPEFLKKISPMLNKAISYLSTKFPKGANFLKGILKNVDKFINKVTQEFGKLFSKKAAVVGATTTGVVFGIDQLIKKIFSPGDIELTPEQIQNLSLGDDIDMDMW
jgi:hypothetical protein